ARTVPEPRGPRAARADDRIGADFGVRADVGVPAMMTDLTCLGSSNALTPRDDSAVWGLGPRWQAGPGERSSRAGLGGAARSRAGRGHRQDRVMGIRAGLSLVLDIETAVVARRIDPQPVDARQPAVRVSARVMDREQHVGLAAR